MNDPGLPPKPRSLNLLESLVKEEEEKDRLSYRAEIYKPPQGTSSTSAEYFDTEKHAIASEPSASSYSEFKMKETKSHSKVAKGDPNAGLKGKRIKKQRSRSNSSERFNPSGKKSRRPFSADYNQNKRDKISTKLTNGRVKSAKGPRRQQRSSAKGRRPASPESYSSHTYSSDEEYPKKEAYRKRAEVFSDHKKPEHDDFFDSDKEQDRKKDNYSSDSSKRSSSADSYSSSEDDHTNLYDRRKSKEKENERNKYSSDDSKHRSSSDSSDGEADSGKDKKTKQGHQSRSDHQRTSKTVYVNKLGQQHTRKRADSEGSDYQRMVVVDDYSSLSEEESVNQEERKSVRKTVTQNPTKRLLSRKKKKRMKIVQIDPDMYLEGKLHQKYCELEELMACSFVDQKSQMTRHHLYQMELLHDQYRTVSHGRPSSAVIIPRSLPEAMRNKSQRPSSAKQSTQKHGDMDQESCDNAYGTMQSVMAAERARKHNKIRTDILAERPSSAKKSGKKKKKLEAKLKSKISDSEEDISEKPSMASKGSTRSDGSTLTPRGVPAIDHHIKYSENDRLKKWLKEKDKLYRKNVKEEKKKKREEREKLINEANDKLEKKIESQKRVKDWMKEKNKEMYIRHKEEKKRHEIERKENKTKEVILPGESMQIKQHRREDDVTVEGDKCKGQDTPEYVKQQIHDKREIEEENKQAVLAEKGGPHPPQTKFIYKRPVAGKIKLNMQVRGKSPTAKRPESGKKESEESEKNDKMRLSYDEWVKKKREDDTFKRKNAAKTKESELAKSDPELNRLIPDLAKRRIEEKLNMRKKVNTGIKSCDEKTNKSFGGGEFDGEASTERPRSAYRLEGDTGFNEQALTVKQIKRPSTAPASRGRMPQPKKSTSSPRKAVIPQRVDKVMENKDDTNPYALPFPPEKGVPPHVAARQRKLFADKVADRLSEAEQKELLQEVLIKEGVADVCTVISDHPNLQDDSNSENRESSKQADIDTLMYSPKKKEESSESSESDNEAKEKPEEETDKEPEEPLKHANGGVSGLEDSPAHIDSFGTVESDKISQENSQNGHDIQSSNQYRTYANLNDLPLHSPDRDASYSSGLGMDLGVDVNQLRERVESLKVESTGPPLIFSSDPRDSYESKSTDEEEDTHRETLKSQNIKVICEDTDQNLIGILKESKKMDNIPVPEHSDEPPEKSHKDPDNENDSTQLDPEESLYASKKRVSFNEQTEVFQSSESSSTDTITPEQTDFDPDAESLDAQPYYIDDLEDGGKSYGNDIEYDNEYTVKYDEYTEPKVEGETLSFNIGGFELNPTVIPSNTEEEKKEAGATFITNPDTEA